MYAALGQDCSTGARVFRDPHLSFAHGGRADFRGRHQVLYNFLSTPAFSVNVKVEEAVFTIHDGALTVNGSFLTEAHVAARLSQSGGRATASFWAAQLDTQNSGWEVVNGSCGGRAYKLGRRGTKKCHELADAIGN